MLRNSIIFLFLVLCTSNALAAGNAWKIANTFYQQKQYDSAAYYYEQIAATKPQEASLYYNLGNTYYRLNKIGLAVLNYQKALYIKPDLKQAADNLALTESRISNRIPTASDIFFVSWWNTLTEGQNNVIWAITSLIIFIVIISLSILRRFGKAVSITSPQLTGTLIVILLICLVFAFASAGNKLHTGMGVVMQNDAPLMNEQHTGKAQNLVPEGTTVTILGTRTGWTQVRLPDGRTGWLQEGLINKI